LSKDWVEDVGEFHKHIDYPEYTLSTPINTTTVLRRLAHMHEELVEFTRALEVHDVHEMSDALTDLIYVAVGTARHMGVDLRPVWDEVHKSNMTKKKMPHNLKHCTKDADFRGPDIVGALCRGKL